MALEKASCIALTTDGWTSRATELGPHIGCFAHTVNLATQRALQTKALSKPLGMVRRIVGYFHRSTTAAALLKSKQQLLSLPSHKLIMDVSTRWNSTFDMLTRFLEMEPAIVACAVSKELRGKNELIMLSESDMKNLEAVVSLLKPMKTITTALCDAGSPTVSLILPFQDRIKRITQVTDGDTGIIRDMKAAVHGDICKRYQGEIRPFLLMATALDARFLSLAFIDNNERSQVYSDLHRKVMESHAWSTQAHKVNVFCTCHEIATV